VRALTAKAATEGRGARLVDEMDERGARDIGKHTFLGCDAEDATERVLKKTKIAD